MKIERIPQPAPKFKPFAIAIQIEEANDAQLLNGLLNKLEAEVKDGGIYWAIIHQIREALKGPA